jgi:hypothetical protein
MRVTFNRNRRIGAPRFMTNRVLQTMLFGVDAHDPISLIAVASLLALAGLVAAAVPALRAASTDPAMMRAE